MSKQPKNSLSVVAAVLFGVVVPFTGCEGEKAPADKGVQDAKGAAANPSPAENARKAVEKEAYP